MTYRPLYLLIVALFIQAGATAWIALEARNENYRRAIISEHVAVAAIEASQLSNEIRLACMSVTKEQTGQIEILRKELKRRSM